MKGEPRAPGGYRLVALDRFVDFRDDRSRQSRTGWTAGGDACAAARRGEAEPALMRVEIAAAGQFKAGATHTLFSGSYVYDTNDNFDTVTPHPIAAKRRRAERHS